jgi:hypothetical protein
MGRPKAVRAEAIEIDAPKAMSHAPDPDSAT